MRISDELILEKKVEKEPKNVEKEPEKVEKMVQGEVTRQAVDPEEIEAVDLASENVRRTEEDEAVAEREAEWRIAKEKRDVRRRMERLAREKQEEEMRPQTDRLRVLADLNSSALADPAVASVVTKKSLERSSAGESSSGVSATGFVRPSRSSHKCMMCVRTFSDLSRLHAHIENHH